MPARPLRRAEALAAVEQAPQHLVAEVLDGVLHLSPRPRVRHALASSLLGASLISTFHKAGSPDGSEQGGWYLLFEPELHLGDGPDIIVPDIAGWRRERMSRLPDAAFIDMPPDWACEVLSPSTQKIDRGPKLAIYAREGVPHLWLLDPEARTLEVLALDPSTHAYRVHETWSDQASVAAPPFASFAWTLGSMWID